MTPNALPALPAAAPAATETQRRAAPESEPATFAAVLDGSVQALSDGGGQDEAAARDPAGADAGPLQVGTEAAALAGEQPRLDALALMLAAAPPPPGHVPPGAATAAAATVAAVAAVAATVVTGAAGAADAAAGVAARVAAAGEVAPPAATPARAASGATAVGTSPPMREAAPEVHSQAGPGARLAGSPPGPIAADAAQDPVRAAAAVQAGPPRREAGTLAPVARQPAAVAAADHGKVAGAAGNAPATAAAGAPATALPVPAGARTAADAGAAGTGNAGPMAAWSTPRSAAQRLAADPVREPAAGPLARAPQGLPGTGQEASPAPARMPPVIDMDVPGAALAAASPPAATGAVAHVAPAVGSPDWAPALAQQLVRLPGGGAVELHLNPVELGPMQVKLSVVEGQAQVVFVAEHAAVRHALEAALPQLRISLAENGITLGHANVGAGAGEQRAGQDGSERHPPGTGREARTGAEDPAAAPGRPRLPPARHGAVDTFA